MNRKDTLALLRKNPDIGVLIVGAGINGIGTFRDLALNGIISLIIDRADFCSGASAASSHMLHGGLRYLENGEFRLVREALHERNLLMRNAPHYARPLPTTIPIFKWFSGWWNAPLKFLNLLNKPAERGAVIIKIGLMMYDAYVRGESPMPGHYFRMRDRSLAEFPGLNPDIICTANYYDGAMVPMERLCTELVLDAEAEGDHARALTYTTVAGAEGDTVMLRDEMTGKTFTVRPRVVINAAGPWIDFANKSLGHPTRLIGGTKGSHLVVDNPELRKSIGDHGFFFENYDGRIVEINPFMDRLLIGTTDIPIDDPDQAVCTEEEQTYILSMVKKVFPDVKIGPEQVVYRYSGVRPLPKANAKTAGQISRDHSIEVIEPGGKLKFPVLSLVGGKWTTYRAFSEQTADAAMARLGAARQYDTADLGIGGGMDYPTTGAARSRWLADAAQQTGIDPERLSTLFERYGTRAREFAAAITGPKGKDKPLRNAPDYSEREIAHLVEAEHVVHLEDLVLRRTLLALMGRMTKPLLEEMAAIAAKSLGWSAAELKRELIATETRLREQQGVTL